MTKTVHQLVHTLSYGDAISGEVLGLRRCFRSFGWESEIYSIHAHPRLKQEATSFKEFPAHFDGEVILHYSLGSPLNDLYAELIAAKRSLIYHNLTPAHWFEGVNPRIVEDIREGERELPQLLACTNRVLADSTFNARELQKLGFGAQVLELPVDPSRWEVESNPGVKAAVSGEPGIHVLHVGRLAPNKCIEDIIKSFFFLHHFIEKQSKLWLVGIDIDTELYSFSLKRLVHELNLTEAVRFAGCLDDSEVRALYETASLYMCMSEHEGFCLPIVEAMHFGCPVISYASSALPDTLGDGGILVREKRHAELAELMYEVYSNQALRERMITAGRSRVGQLSFDRFENEVRELFHSPPTNVEAQVGA